MLNRLDELWEDRRHWKMASIYVCKEDPRVVVRKRIGGMGWTFNFAHRASFLLLFLVIAACGVPFLPIVLGSEPTTMQAMQALLLSLILMVGLIFIFSKIGRE